jgi:hypothetical protein
MCSCESSLISRAQARKQVRVLMREKWGREDLSERFLERLTDAYVERWERNFAIGSRRARTEDILRILARRNVSVSEHERTVIEGCTDMDTLEMWFDQALVIDDINDLFAR